MAINEKKIRDAYLEEINELLESLNHQLLSFENSPEEKEIINEIFRLTHSIKSESALVGYLNIAKVAHKMEDIFDKIKNNSIRADRNVMNALFKSYDKIMELTHIIQNNGDESIVDISNEINILNKILNIDIRVKKDGVDIKKKDEKHAIKRLIEDNEVKQLEVIKGEINELKVDFTEIEMSQIEESIEKGEIFYKLIVYLAKDCDLRYPRAYLVYNNFENIGTIIRTNPNILLEGDDKKFSIITFYFMTKSGLNKIKECADVDQVDKIEVNKINLKALKKVGLDISQFPGTNDILVTEEEIKEGQKIEREWQKRIEEQILEQEKKKSILKEEKAKTFIKGEEVKISHESIIPGIDISIKRQTIRVDTDRLDLIMNLVGELIINQSRFIQIKNTMNDKSSIQMVKAELEDAASELDRIADQMQSSMMLVRMIPIGTVFSRFPRMVRDLANNLQKNVKLNISGEGTEIDKAIIELITEPLTHIIRNSIDHGIERPEIRSRKKKPREGTIELRAYQQGSNIYIEVSDDGNGIDIEMVKNEGIKKGLITQQQAGKISEKELYDLLFEPGFSTKEEITGLSGRGVGLDVVRKQVDKLRGTIEIESKPGVSTKFSIILPLTLTILEAMLVNISENLFAIPVNVIEETLLIKKEEIKDFDEYKVYDLRNETVAILFLSELIGYKVKEEIDEYFVVIVSYEHRKIGLVVDELIGHQNIVIKPLDESLKSLEGIAGATVLGDGKIALILDINMLVRSRKRELGLMSEALDLFKDKEGGFGEFYDDIQDEKTNGDNKKINKKELVDEDIKITSVKE